MKRSLRRWLVVLTLAAGAGALGGCYERVVGAQGFGSDSTSISKSNLPPDKGTRTLGYPKYTPKSLPGE